jgi:hypothetical protein
MDVERCPIKPQLLSSNMKVSIEKSNEFVKKRKERRKIRKVDS